MNKSIGICFILLLLTGCGQTQLFYHGDENINGDQELQILYQKDIYECQEETNLKLASAEASIKNVEKQRTGNPSADIGLNILLIRASRKLGKQRKALMLSCMYQKDWKDYQ